jgi:hypothetical protein
MKTSLSLWIFSVFLAILCFEQAWGQEVCNNGIDDDADGLIDCYDPDCCDDCDDFYFQQCESSCFFQYDRTNDFELEVEYVYRNNWNRRNTPLVGNLHGGDTTFIIGMSSNPTTSILNANFQIINGTDQSTYELPTTHYSNQGISYAIANLDNSGRAEIIVATDEASDRRRLEAYQMDGENRIARKLYP